MIPQTERPYGGLKAGNAELPLQKMEIEGVITGLLHRTTVSQTFFNDHAVPLEAVYIHPLPPKASVHGFRLVVGSRVVEGRVQERSQARQAYQQAVAQGHRAAMMEEERSDIFTTTVGNIAPGEKVTISFELSGPLEFLESTASLRFPLVVPEVYISGDPLPGGQVGDGVAVDTTSVPDASRITPPRLPDGAPNPVNLRLSFKVDAAGLNLESVTSLCHFARTKQRDNGITEISLLPGLERLGHDFVVCLGFAKGSMQTTLVSDPHSGAFALTVVPPISNRPPSPRDIVIVLDRSGSMQGWSMTAARRAACRMVESLTPRDRFAIVAFDSQQDLLDPHLVPADARNQQRAQAFLSGIEARGGTAARPAIEQALKLLLTRETSADRTVLFVTDGDVGNDAELVARSQTGVRISTVGIGQNSRAGVLEAMAKSSGGLCTMIPDPSTLEEALRNLHQRLGRPHWMGLSLEGQPVSHQAPRFWDVWEGVPTTFFGHAANLPSVVRVEGWLASSGRHQQQVSVQRRDDSVISRSWARARLLDLDDLWTVGLATPQELVTLSVETQVLCRFTAFAALDTAEVVDNASNLLQVVQPVEGTLRRESPVKAQEMLQSTWLDSAVPRRAAKREAPARFSEPIMADQGRLGMRAQPAPQASRVGLSRSLSSSPPMGPPKQVGQKPSLGGPPSPPPAPCPRPALSQRASLGQAPSPPISQQRPPDLHDKKRPGNDVWEALAELLKRFLAAATLAQKKAIVTEMIDALGAHHRGGLDPVGSQQAALTARTMSTLVDLQDQLDNSEDLSSTLEELKTLIASA
jgi:Ca-activated chloride channel family protein